MYTPSQKSWFSTSLHRRAPYSRVFRQPKLAEPVLSVRQNSQSPRIVRTHYNPRARHAWQGRAGLTCRATYSSASLRWAALTAREICRRLLARSRALSGTWRTVSVFQLQVSVFFFSDAALYCIALHCIDRHFVVTSFQRFFLRPRIELICVSPICLS